MTTHYTKPMDLERADSNGRFAQEVEERMGTVWLHQATMVSYTITGVAWNGDTDQWMVIHKPRNFPDGGVFVRSIHNFFGGCKHQGSRFIKELDI